MSGTPVLVPAAVEAVKQWKYQPLLIGGEAIEVETTVEIGFNAVNGAPRKALDFSGCNFRPATGLLHPVATEAAAASSKSR